MIESKELRIGNFFEWSPIASMGIGIGIIEKGSDIDRYNQFKDPIPLTPEILSDLNFEDCMNHPRSPHFHLHNPWMILYKEPVKELVWRLGKHKDCFIRYVHQLQNIYFFLFGKEIQYSPNIK